jgi:hypothetical protein
MALALPDPPPFPDSGRGAEEDDDAARERGRAFIPVWADGSVVFRHGNPAFGPSLFTILLQHKHF